MKKLICEYRYKIGDEIYHGSLTMWVENIVTYDIRYEIQEYELKRNNKAIVIDIQVNIVESSFNLS